MPSRKGDSPITRALKLVIERKAAKCGLRERIRCRNIKIKQEMDPTQKSAFSTPVNGTKE
jgi:hypothetical protein